MDADTHYDILTTIRDDLITLDLPEIGRNVIRLAVPLMKQNAGVVYPVVVVSPVGSEQGFDGALGTNLSDDIRYPVLVAIIDVANEGETRLSRWLNWRASIADRLIHKRYTATLPRHMDTVLEPGQIIDPAAWASQWFLSTMTARLKFRQVRRA